jgi:hypothetical protein
VFQLADANVLIGTALNNGLIPLHGPSNNTVWSR